MKFENNLMQAVYEFWNKMKQNTPSNKKHK